MIYTSRLGTFKVLQQEPPNLKPQTHILTYVFSAFLLELNSHLKSNHDYRVMVSNHYFQMFYFDVLLRKLHYY